VSIGDDLSDTISALSRDFVSVAYTDLLPRCDNPNWVLCENVVKQFKPQFAQPGVYRDCVMVDLSSAYWNIIRRIGYTVRYRPGRSLGVSDPIEYFPWKDNKLARAMLLSCALESGLWWWNGKDTVKFEKTFNVLYQPMLVAAVYDILHGVASDMGEALLYYNVDGGIIRNAHLPLWTEVCESWGLPWKIKAQGYALVRSVGSYSIGNIATKGSKKTNHHFSNLKPRNGWLRQRFLAFSGLSDPD
jgi:hypothetical protein